MVISVFIHFSLQFYDGEITCDINHFLFLFFTMRYTFSIVFPQRGLCRSDQFNCNNIRQSQFGSVFNFVIF